MSRWAEATLVYGIGYGGKLGRKRGIGLG